MYGSLKSPGARKERCIGFTDERSRNGEMRIWMRVEELGTRERKVKYRVICKFHHLSSH